MSDLFPFKVDFADNTVNLAVDSDFYHFCKANGKECVIFVVYDKVYKILKSYLHEPQTANVVSKMFNEVESMLFNEMEQNIEYHYLLSNVKVNYDVDINRLQGSLLNWIVEE